MGAMPEIKPVNDINQAGRGSTDSSLRKVMRLQVNGAPVEHLAEPRTHLGDFLREQCGLTGTHLGCEHGVCGACTVLLDGKPIRSCITFAAACENHAVTTIEGYGDDVAMTQLRRAFTQEHALQCGYCTPGMLATAYDIVTRLPDADEARIRTELSGNLCRCTGYVGIVRAIESVLVERRSAAPAAPAAPAAAAIATTATVSAAPMKSFTAQAWVSTPTASDSSTADAPAADAALAAASRKGWSHMESSFELDYPPQQVWHFMGDVSALAACLPGAEVQETDGSSVKGRIAIKFGPISAAFNGAATLERNEDSRTGMLRGAGTDSISQSRAKGDVGYKVVGLDGDRRSRVEVTLDHMLQGPLAQFSRSGLVRDFVTRMIAEFGRNLAASMSGAKPEQLPARSIGMFSMLWQIIWNRLRGK